MSEGVTIIIHPTERAPLLSEKPDSDQNSIDTVKTYTYDACEESSFFGTSYESDEFHPDHRLSPMSSLRGHTNGDLEEHQDEHQDEDDHHHDHHHHCEGTLPSLVEGVVEEFHDLTEAARDAIHMVDEDDHYMIEMGLTRNLSILHDDVVEASEVLQGSSSDEDASDIEKGGDSSSSPDVPGSIPWSACLLLFTAVVAMSTVGPLLQLQADTTATMKVLWRMTGTSLLLSPLAAMDIYHHAGIPKLTYPQWFTFFLSTFWFVLMAMTFCLALDYTSVGNAVILSNSLALILLVGRLCTGVPVTTMELTGALVAFGGAVLCSRDAAGATMTTTDYTGLSSGLGTTLIGDLLALVSAIAGVGYVTCAKTSRAHLPLFLFTFLTMAAGTVMVVVFQVAVLRERLTWDCDASYGFWGFLVWNRFDRLRLEVVMVLICNLLGTMGYARAMPHFDSIVICSVQLLEPVIAEFLSYFAGVGVLPGLIGWIGNAAVAGGTIVVLLESQASHNNTAKPAAVEHKNENHRSKPER